jgi:hypothetical protein
MQTHNGSQWVLNEEKQTDGHGELCGPGWLHAYSDPLVAVLHNPMHAAIIYPRLFKVECGGNFKDDSGLKCGYTSMKLIEEISLPGVNLTQQIAYGILCSLEVYRDSRYVTWAQDWLSGRNRAAAASASAATAAAITTAAATTTAAAASASAATAAADAAAYAAATAAITTTAAAAAAATAAITTAAAARTLGFGPCLIDVQCSAFQVFAVHFGDSRLCLGLCRHFDKSESPGLAAELILYYRCRLYLTECLERLFQFVFGYIRCQVTYINVHLLSFLNLFGRF